MFKRVTTVLSMAMLGASLAACTHKNPLANPDKQTVASFLVKASSYAEKQMKLGLDNGGYVYADCMDKRANINCNTLYGYMVSFAKTQPGFHELTTQDLTDLSLWKTNANDYVRVQFQQL